MKNLIERLEASSDEVESHPHPSHCEHLHVAFKVMREAAAALRALTAIAPGEQSAPDHAPAALDKTAPERIWLQIDPAGNNEDRQDEWPKVPDGVTWCWHSIGGLEIQYVRTDLAQQPASLAPQPATFNFAAHLQRQREWSTRTFGPGARTAGVIDHIRKELREIEAAPHDGEEWIDAVILALDGAWRSGLTPQQIIETMVGKQTKNEGRAWPDWRTADPNKAIEHDRNADQRPAVDQRYPATNRRERAVSTLIEAGWKWDGAEWQQPTAVDEDRQEANSEQADG